MPAFVLVVRFCAPHPNSGFARLLRRCVAFAFAVAVAAFVCGCYTYASWFARVCTRARVLVCCVCVYVQLVCAIPRACIRIPFVWLRLFTRTLHICDFRSVWLRVLVYAFILLFCSDLRSVPHAVVLRSVPVTFVYVCYGCSDSRFTLPLRFTFRTFTHATFPTDSYHTVGCGSFALTDVATLPHTAHTVTVWLIFRLQVTARLRTRVAAHTTLHVFTFVPALPFARYGSRYGYVYVYHHALRYRRLLPHARFSGY